MLVVGLARSGVAAALALRARGEDVIGVDAGAGAGEGADLLTDAGVELHLRAQGLALLERVNAVIKSPGVPAQAPVIAAAVERGLPVLGELELAWRMLPNEFIAVTGTNGKTTTVELIGHIHREAGMPAAVAGNVGTPVSSLVGSVSAEATVVCEASSFQLEDTLEFAPEAAVLLNLTQDHLDRHQTMAAYLAAKLQIFAHQGSGDIAVVPISLCPGDERRRASGPVGELRATRVSFGTEVGSTLVERSGELWWGELPLLAVSELSLLGRHNVENAMAAAAVCLARGIDRDAVRAGLRSFRGVPHRLEEVARQKGVLYVNDSKATNVTSTLVALSAFTEGAPDVRGRACAQQVRGAGQLTRSAPHPTGADPRATRARAQSTCASTPSTCASAQPTSAPAQSTQAGVQTTSSATQPTGSGIVRSAKPIHLIMGGQGKSQDFTVLRGPVARSCAAVYLIGEDAELIGCALRGVETQLRVCHDLEHAVTDAARAAAPGEVVLLSPACASFDQFADFEARGERFRALVDECRFRGRD